MRRGRSLLLLTLAAPAFSCGGAAEPPAPHGEALVVVDTDLPVPRLASRMRVDLYGADGRWFESRDIGRPDPRDWPASFSVFSDDDRAPKDVLVRIRVYPEGLVRDYEGERFEARPAFRPKTAAANATELCASAPELPLGGRITLRLGSTKLTEIVSGESCTPAESGAVAARVVVATKGTYRFDVADVWPYSTYATLVLRSRCEDVSSQLDCRTEPRGASIFTPGHLPRFDADLDPGTYWLVATNFAPHWPADVTLEAMATETPLPDPAPLTREPSASPAEPRLVRGEERADRDETPRSEPLPSASIDRLLLLRLVPGVRGRVRVSMKGACAGTTARLGADARRPDPATATTCVDTEDVRVPVTPSALEDDMTRTYASEQGAFGHGEPCDAPVAEDDPFVCVPGGSFVFGSRLVSTGTATNADSSPERIASMPRFWMDRYEVSVARFRDAVARGLSIDPTRIAFNERALPTWGKGSTRFDDYCTWSESPLERESTAVSCINWDLARAFCRMHGGELPTEAQWEYAASVAGRARPALYPWGDDGPTCDRVVAGRGNVAFGDPSCVSGDVRMGPAPIDAAASGDVTPLGIVGMAGGVAEWMLDSGASFTSDCWRSASLTDPRCWEEDAPMRSVRGAAWSGSPLVVGNRVHLPPGMAAHGIPGAMTGTPFVGFRCVYPERPR